MIQVSKAKKNWWDWAQIGVTTILVPLILGAWRWAGTVGERISSNAVEIRMNKKDIDGMQRVLSGVAVQIDKLVNQTSEILQRISSIEARLPK